MLTVTCADGTDIRAYDEGRGPVILVAHPGLDDGRSWAKVAAQLAPRFRVVRLHRRQYRLDLPPCSMAREAEDVVAVATALGEPVVLVGHSSGGVVALEAMAAAPAPFAGAVLYEPPTLLVPAEWGEQIERSRAAVAAGRPGKAMRLFIRDVVKEPAFVARLAGLLVALHPRYRALAPRQVADAEAIDQLGVRLDAYGAIEVPTVLLGGDRSPAHLGERLDALARTLPRAERVGLAGQGHTAHQSAPAEVARIVAALADRVLRA
jgi:pimeloyl-ACP methyl ester carboxylesterase